MSRVIIKRINIFIHTYLSYHMYHMYLLSRLTPLAENLTEHRKKTRTSMYNYNTRQVFYEFFYTFLLKYSLNNSVEEP